MYLIVIDDIWDEEPWDKVIRHALIENNMRSRIITTTRIIDVAEHIGGCYRLKPLSKESSEMLFYGRIFGSKDIFPMQFSEVSKKILKKCGGIPLAIITASGLLANKSENIKEWFKVCDSIGSGLGSNHVMDSMRKILLLSYYDLPFHLKTCLLYLSIFPEDYAISKTQLIWRWVAEGFVQQAGDQSLFEIGKSYFNELLNRSLIQPAYMDRDGTPRACRVHDAVLDLVISLSIKEQFITILGDGKHSLESKYQVRWLSLLHNNNTAWPSMKMPKLRSLTIFKPTGVVIDPMTPSISCYHLLRVLDLQGCNVEDLASLGFVGSLTHLRYLGLPSSSTNAKLPVEMGKLRFLQTLDLSKAGVKEMPSSVITGLGGQLMCLRGQNGLGTDLSSDLLENLTSLELLESATVTSKCTAEKLGRMTQLRVLSVIIRLSTPDDEEWSACTNALVESLGKLTRIESLQIHHHRFYPIDLEGSMAEPLENLCRLVCIDLATLLPGWIQPASLPILSYLEIDVRDERREDIKVLGTLSCLRHLVFRVRLAPELQVLERCVVGPDAFPCLVSCEFHVRGGGVVPGIFPRGAMPRLQNFKFSVKPEHFWSGGGSTVDVLVLGHLPSLRSVTVTLGFLHNREDDTIKSVREKLEHEAAAHPNHPLRILFTS
ncbi:hypothetical protein PVAP13_2NG549800 [Panicum virgatum]|uniref:NB-ARC domain-containing protein n=1 Tax=Panicum virgatum TaxID=38727 RepID=A0A8T0VM31_PANVG|nr:hypothetical protein PVAP13_2NG549800 [Panicum virgatum]